MPKSDQTKDPCTTGLCSWPRAPSPTVQSSKWGGCKGVFVLRCLGTNEIKAAGCMATSLSALPSLPDLPQWDRSLDLTTVVQSSLVTPTGARMPTAQPTPSPSCWWQRLTSAGRFAARSERSRPPSFLETRCGHGTKFWVIGCEWKYPEGPMSAGKGLFCFLCQFCQDDRSLRSYFSR